MDEPFDPYYRWLGIPPEEQPPDHYRLLGIKLFEDHPDVIETAADRQMTHLRTFQTGVHSEWSQRLLNEVAAAKVCLLNAEKKREYDRQLCTRAAVSQPPVPQPPVPSVPLPLGEGRVRGLSGRRDADYRGTPVPLTPGPSPARGEGRLGDSPFPVRGEGRLGDSPSPARVEGRLSDGLSAPPVSAPPVSAPPVSAPPVSAPPVSAPPALVPPVSEPPQLPFAGTLRHGQSLLPAPVRPWTAIPWRSWQFQAGLAAAGALGIVVVAVLVVILAGKKQETAGPAQPSPGVDENNPPIPQPPTPPAPPTLSPGPVAPTTPTPPTPSPPNPSPAAQSNPPAPTPSPPPEPVESGPAPVPDAAAQRAAEAQLRTLLAGRDAAATIDEATRADHAPAERYVLLVRACHAAAAACDVATAMRAVEELSRRFQIDRLVEESELLAGMERTAAEAGQWNAVSEAEAALAERALAAGNHDLASRVAQRALVAARKAGNDPRATDITKRILSNRYVPPK